MAASKKSAHTKKFAKLAKACHREVKEEGVTGKARAKAVGACMKEAFGALKKIDKKK